MKRGASSAQIKTLDGKVKSHEVRLKRLEVTVDRIAKELELASEIVVKVDPFKYARDDLDREIIKLLLTNKVITSTQIAEKVGTNRHMIGKRLQRMEKESEDAGEKWLKFIPKEKEGHFRAWWVISDIIKT